MIVNARFGCYVLATTPAWTIEPPEAPGLGLYPHSAGLVVSTLHTSKDERVLVTPSYFGEEDPSQLEQWGRSWPYIAMAEVTTSDVLCLVTAKGKTIELTPGGGTFGVAVHARMAPDDWPAKDPREHHLLTLWPIHPTVLRSRFELPRERPEEPPAPRTSLAGLIAMFRDETTPLVRTDFSDDEAWLRVVAAVTAPTGSPDNDYAPNISPVDARNFADLDPEALAAAYDDETVGFVLIADSQSMQASDDPTVIYVDLYDEPGSAFRCVASEVASIEANLSIANLDFEDFAANVDPDGVFRGFPSG